MSPLHVSLDTPMPRSVGVGAGTAVFVAGWCAGGSAPPRALSLLVDGVEQPVTAHGMPRLDVGRAIGPHAYRSGFWGLASIAPTSAATVEIGLCAVLADGRVHEQPLATIAVERPAAPSPLEVSDPHPPGPLVAIAMATYEPPAELLRRQLDSIRAQTHANWVCVISDDCSTPETFAALEAEVAGDPRFVVSRSPRRQGFYRNFERALGLVPATAALVALADQDDTWHADKLATLVGALGSAQLVYSDARIVRLDGTPVAETFWGTRRNRHDDLRSLLMANAISGGASLFPRALLDVALPFPPGQFSHFHDHWLGLVALSLGYVAFVDRPLYDYVQHGDAVIGHEAATRVTAWRERVARLRRPLRARVRIWRMHYFVDIQRLRQLATILLLRAGARMPAAKRRALERFLRADTSLRELARMWAHGARELLRHRPETLGAEWMLAYALTWRRLLVLTARDRPVRGLRLDAIVPTNLAPPPGLVLPEGEAGEMEAKVAPLGLAVGDDVPPRINLLIPTIDLAHLFGGYIAKLNLARRLADRGARVRIVTVDPAPPLPPDWREQVESYEGLSGLFERVEVVFGREAFGGVEVSREDRWVATTFRTAHVAAAAVRDLRGERFLYLIQEYEPLTVPHEGWAALAEQSYAFAHVPLFSTELLRDFFVARGLAAPDALVFSNAITPVPAPTAESLAARRSRRLLFYARPEAHAARNLFDVGLEALRRVAAGGALAGWELRGIGTTEPGRRIDLGAGAELELVPRASQGGYAALLAEHDVGLALMDTPHPSLVPIEMASAGMLTVTSTFASKTATAMTAISPNIIAAEPTAEAVAAALVSAVGRADDAQGRAAGSRVVWARDWDEAFGDDLIDRALEQLGS